MSNSTLEKVLEDFSPDTELHIAVNTESRFSYLTISQHKPDHPGVFYSIKLAVFLNAINVSDDTFKRSVIKSLINSLKKEVSNKKEDYEKAINALKGLDHERAA